MSGRSEFVDLTRPLKDRLKLYDATKSPNDQPKNAAADPAKRIPQGFMDAMIVREEVFVNEQKVPLENEFDSDDPRSFHWTVYASIPVKTPTSPTPTPLDEKIDQPTTGRRKSSGTSTKIPVGTIRLVPPPHEPHHSPAGDNPHSPTGHAESYVKLGRLAVIKEFRKTGVSRLLIETALAFARDNPYELLPQYDPSILEALRQEDATHAGGMDFRGLLLVHAQTGVQKVWAKYGFEVDREMGSWVEEGMEHVGMWRRVNVAEGRRKSKAWLPSMPVGSP